LPELAIRLVIKLAILVVAKGNHWQYKQAATIQFIPIDLPEYMDTGATLYPFLKVVEISYPHCYTENSQREQRERFV